MLGRRLLTYVRDVMRIDAQLPHVELTATVHDALFEMTEKRLGMTAVVDHAGLVKGIFTDGDLRRLLAKRYDLTTLKMAEVMTAQPHTISPDQLAMEAVAWMERYRINQVLVVDETHKLIGALNMHDLFNAKVI